MHLLHLIVLFEGIAMNHIIYQLNEVTKRFSDEVFLSNHGLSNEVGILLITGVGKVYPFMRSHNILDNLQHIFSDIPVVLLYPGTYNGQELSLFDEFQDGNYYRAFNMI